MCQTIDRPESVIRKKSINRPESGIRHFPLMCFMLGSILILQANFITKSAASLDAASLDIPRLTAEDIVSPLEWTYPFAGHEFYRYKAKIDKKIKAYRSKLTNTQHCEMPLFKGEFGYELAGIVPWAYYKAQDCQMTTVGRPGTKYLYYFSKEHSIQKSQGNEPQRSSHRLPKDSPFGESPHFHNDKFPTSGWVPPPYKNFFKMTNLKLDKPLLIISNKYTMEWDDGPINHIPFDSLFEILKFLTPRYHIVYNRFKDPRLEDKLEVQLNKNGMSDIAPYHDKEMIKRFFPSVVFFEELSENLDTDDVNLLMFALGAEAERFISVQGGNSVIASFFGGTNIIHAVKGPEVNWKSDIGGDFSYYHRFSNATIRVEQSGKSFCRAVKEDFVEDQQSVSQYCM